MIGWLGPQPQPSKANDNKGIFEPDNFMLVILFFERVSTRKLQQLKQITKFKKIIRTNR